MTDLKSDFGEAIRAELKRQGLSQRDYAERLGVTQALVGRALSPTANPTLETITRFADALGLELKLTARRTPRPK